MSDRETLRLDFLKAAGLAGAARAPARRRLDAAV